MIKSVLQTIIRGKNPQFQFDEAITGGLLVHLIWSKTLALWRGLWLQLAHFRKPVLIFVGKKVQIFNARNLIFGKWVQLEDYAYLSALGSEPIRLGNNVKIGAYSRVIISTTFNQVGRGIAIGNNVGLGEFAYLGGAGGLEIGDDCIIGQYFSCHPENHQFDDPDVLIRLQPTVRNGIKVGKNCWIGSKVTILDGVTIGDGCVVAAGAVVTKNMPDGVVIGGVPAKVLKVIHPAKKDMTA